MDFIPAISACIVAAVVTRALVSIAPRLRMVDVPNERSLHTEPVATIGGVGLLAGVVAAIGVWRASSEDPSGLVGLCLAAVILTIFVLDEREPMRWTTKLILQALAAAFLLWWTSVLLPVPWLAFPISLLFLCYTQNIYNFMDGLDGLSGLTGCVTGAFLFLIFIPAYDELSRLGLWISAASLGFVVWNLPTARIFMGDVGSHFLGLSFGWVAIAGISAGVPIYVSLLPLGPFLYDATYTLARRAIRRENITRAHRYHLYQRLRRSGFGAWTVDGIYVVWACVCGGAALAIQRDADAQLAISCAGLSALVMTVWVEVLWGRSGEHE